MKRMSVKDLENLARKDTTRKVFITTTNLLLYVFFLISDDQYRIVPFTK